MRNITSITDIMEEILSLEPEQDIAYQLNAQNILYICNTADDNNDFQCYHIAVYRDTEAFENDEPISEYDVMKTNKEELVSTLNEIMDMYGAFTQEELKLMYAAMRHYRENLIEMRRKFYDDGMDDIADKIADKTTTAFNAIEKIRGMIDEEG